MDERPIGEGGFLLPEWRNGHLFLGEVRKEAISSAEYRIKVIRIT